MVWGHPGTLAQSATVFVKMTSPSVGAVDFHPFFQSNCQKPSNTHRSMTNLTRNLWINVQTSDNITITTLSAQLKDWTDYNLSMQASKNFVRIKNIMPIKGLKVCMVLHLGSLTPGRKGCLNLQTFYSKWRISFLFTATLGYLKWKMKRQIVKLYFIAPAFSVI